MASEWEEIAMYPYLVTDTYMGESYYDLPTKDEVLEIVEMLAPDMALNSNQRLAKEELLNDLKNFGPEDIYQGGIESETLNIHIGYIGAVPGYPETGR